MKSRVFAPVYLVAFIVIFQVVERLFVVSQPKNFPDHIMRDAFCRFGGLIDAHFMAGLKLILNLDLVTFDPWACKCHFLSAHKI